MEYKTYSPSTPEALQALTKEHGNVQVLSQLLPKELSSPASKWTIRHLMAYRLLVTAPAQLRLPVLESSHDSLCPLCTQTDDFREQQGLDSTGAYALLEANPPRLRQKTEYELMELPAGTFWVDLARATSPEYQLERAYPQRDRKQAQREGYVDSRDAILGSSSPVYSSPSDFSMSYGVDEDEHEARQAKTEDVTVHLTLTFLHYAVIFFRLQYSANLSADIDIRPRVERILTTTRVAQHVCIAAEDDGGISVLRLQANGWTLITPRLALIEAKRAFKRVLFDDKMEEHIPVVSNETLAQCLGEAVITWKAYPELQEDGVFLIHTTTTFMRIVHFSFGCDYLEYLDTEGLEPQSEIANDERKDAFVYMASTRWFNLGTCEERRSALCCIVSLLRWHADKGLLPTQFDTSDVEEEDHMMEE